METKPQVARRWNKALVALAAALAIGLGSLVAWRSHQVSLFDEWNDRVQLLILELASRRPADVSTARWDNCVGCTWNLHVNYGTSWSFPAEQREPFVAAFEQRLKQPIELDTIDWIWDEYQRRAPVSNRYDRFRPTTPEELKEADERESRGQATQLDSLIREYERRKP